MGAVRCNKFQVYVGRLLLRNAKHTTCEQLLVVVATLALTQYNTTICKFKFKLKFKKTHTTTTVVLLLVLVVVH